MPASSSASQPDSLNIERFEGRGPLVEIDHMHLVLDDIDKAKTVRRLLVEGRLSQPATYFQIRLSKVSDNRVDERKILIV